MIISDSCIKRFFSVAQTKKSRPNSSMRLEKEESQLCILVALKANYFLQDYHMYARTRNRSNITRVVIISDRKRFLWKQDPENCKSQRDNRLKVRASISKVVLSSKLCFDEGSKNVPLIYKYQWTMYFCSLKNHSKTYKPRNKTKTFFLFRNFSSKEKKSWTFCVLRDSVLPALVFKILCHFCPLLRILIFTIFAAFSAFH